MPFQPLPLAASLGRSGPEIFFHGTGIRLLVPAAFLLSHSGTICHRMGERARAVDATAAVLFSFPD